MRWAEGTLDRHELLLIPESLDDCLSPDHAVRLLDEVLVAVDWSPWEATYKNVPHGRPPLRPRLLASILLYGLLTQIRSSRKLEAVLYDRIDFRWLAKEEKVDHTTLSEFRRLHPEALKDLFVKSGWWRRRRCSRR